MILQIFKYPRYVFIALVISFIIFNIRIYSIPEYDEINSQNIASGKEIWQQNNCHTCHQLYGLGGYLGPDLTNVVAKPGYSQEHLKGIIKNGIFQMPGFNLSNQELNDLLLFLEAANQSGSAKPIDYEPTIMGTYTKKQKE